MSNDEFKTAIVPWKNPAEFNKVYQSAYSEELAKNRWAIEQIAVWETRCWPSLPYAVEATLLFVRSKIQDHLYEANKSFCLAQEVEMMYSNSVVRFVNLLLENDQNAKKKKRISYLAAERNIPPWIVDIRHNSTHGFHPTLPVLRMAYQTCMSYLEETFWKPESSRISCIKKSVDETNMVELWHDYIAKQLQVIEASKITKDEFIKSVDLVLEKMSKSLNKSESRKTLLNVLVRDFAPKDILQLIQDDEEFKSNYRFCNSLPAMMQEFYNPLIYLLHKHNLISTFLELLLLSQEKRPVEIQQAIVDFVVLYILNLVKGVEGFDGSAVVPFIHKGVNLNLYRLLYCCARGCSSSASVVFDWLKKEMKLETWAEDISHLMNIRQGRYIMRHDHGKKTNQKRKYDITFTAEDLEEDIYEVMAGKNPRPIKNSWALAPLNIDWASLPLGHVFNPVDIAVKEEPKDEEEKETRQLENFENDNDTNSCEESKPVEKTNSKRFIFKESPQFSSMIYQ